MSTQTVSNISRKVTAIVAAALLATTANFAGAQSVSNIAAANSSLINKDQEKVQVKYLGSLEDGVMFNVLFNNTAESNFSLSILDENGETVYTGVFNDKQFDKKFKIAKNFSKLTFVIKGDKDKFEQSFNINISSRVVEDVAVSKN
jgi:hypothetical protein